MKIKRNIYKLGHDVFEHTQLKQAASAEIGL